MGVNERAERAERIEHLVDALKEARIYAGAELEACYKEARIYTGTEFEASCNEGVYPRAIYFSGFENILATYIRSLEDYKDLFMKKDLFPKDCCPVCGKKTSEGKNGGKI